MVLGPNNHLFTCIEVQPIVDDVVGLGCVPHEGEFSCADVELLGNQSSSIVDDCCEDAGPLLNGHVFVHVNSHLVDVLLNGVEGWAEICCVYWDNVCVVVEVKHISNCVPVNCNGRFLSQTLHHLCELFREGKKSGAAYDVQVEKLFRDFVGYELRWNHFSLDARKTE